MKLFAKLTAISLLSLTASIATGQTYPEFRIIFNADTHYRAARLTSKLSQDRYILAEQKMGIKAKAGNHRIFYWHVYAIDCNLPVKITLVQSMYNLELDGGKPPNWGVYRPVAIPEEFNLGELKYLPLAQFEQAQLQLLDEPLRSQSKPTTPEDSYPLAEFACAAGRAPSSEKEVANQVLRSGGLGDVKTLLCDIESPGKKRDELTIGFSDSRGFLHVNGLWKISPSVMDDAISYGDETYTVHVNRRTGKLRMLAVKYGNEEIASGQCEVDKGLPKKF